MKVAFVIYNFEVGGTELNAVRTAEALDPGRFDVRVIALNDDGPLRERYETAGISTTVFPVRSLVRPGAFREILRMSRHFREERIDVVHGLDLYGNIVGVPSARIAGVPRVLASRRWWKRDVQPRVLRANRLACRMAHQAVGNSEAVGRLLVEDEGVRSDRVRIIPNFLDDDDFADPPEEWIRTTRSEWGLKPEDLVLGIVARLVPVKNHAALIRSMGALVVEQPNVKLVVVGDGPERNRLEELAVEMDIARHIVFTGHRARSPLCHHLFDVSVLPSFSEGFPNSVIEAMAAGIPVVATRVGGTADAIVHGETGLLVPADEHDMLTGALHLLLSDAGLRDRMGREGRARAEAVFARDRVVPMIERLYAGPVGGRFAPVADTESPLPAASREAS